MKRWLRIAIFKQITLRMQNQTSLRSWIVRAILKLDLMDMGICKDKIKENNTLTIRFRKAIFTKVHELMMQESSLRAWLVRALLKKNLQLMGLTLSKIEQGS
jgi:hypothetical protein